tara:strand:+ start:10616 stop:10726 length:111 start_codon:yes stop_codon:yes gene_type:complete
MEGTPVDNLRSKAFFLREHSEELYFTGQLWQTVAES